MLKIFFIILFLFFLLFQSVFGNNSFLDGKKLENQIIKNNEKSPDFKINFQRPSYVDDINGEEIIYKCDNEKDECKVNFNFTKLSGRALSSKLKCELITDFSSNQFSKCNPNTVIFLEGTHEIILKVSEKKNLENFSIKKIVIINGEINTENKYFEYLGKLEKIKKLRNKLFSGEVNIGKIISDEVKIEKKEEDINNTEINSEGQSDNENNTESKKEKSDIQKKEIPEFNYIFQSPSYVLEKNIVKNKYFCDDSREECKINLKLETSEGKDISSKFGCKIKIKSDSEEIILDRCNPTTKVLSKKEDYEISFKIYQKNFLENFKEKNIIISNIDKVKNNNKNIEKKEDDEINNSEISSEGKNSDNIENKSEEEIVKTSYVRHFLPQTKISIQGKIGKNKKISYKKLTCLTYKKCSINFTSGKINKSQRKGVSFYWDFGNGEKYYGYNPKSIKFLPGEYRVKLKVLDIYGNKKIEYFNLEILRKYKKSEKKKISKNLELIINYKEESYNYLNKNYFGLKKNYFSKNFNKIVIRKLQKNYKKLIKNIGKIEIKNIFGKIKKTRITRKNKKKKISFSTEIFSPLENKIDKNKLKQEKVIIRKLRKNIKLNISFQKKNLKISGKTFPKSKVVISIGKQKYYLFSDNSGKYILKTHNLKVGNYRVLASVYSKEGVLVAQKFSKEKVITKKYITKMKSYINKKRLPKYKKKIKKTIFKIKKKTFKVTKNILEKKPDFGKIAFNINVFIFNILLGIMGVIMIFFILIRKKIF